MLQKFRKRLTAILVASLLCLSTITVPTSAISNLEYMQDSSVNDYQSDLNIIPVSEFGALRQQNNVSLRAVNEARYISGYNDFIPYFQTEFNQVNGCGPTAVANLLSFFQGVRNVRLFDGDVITQNIYNQICSDVGWTTSGTNMVNVSNGLQTFCNRAGKNCVIDTYLLNLWSDVTRDINAGKPILLNDVTQNHFMVIFGYEIVNDVKYLYVCTGLSNSQTSLFGYLQWGTDTIRMRSVNIY